MDQEVDSAESQSPVVQNEFKHRTVIRHGCWEDEVGPDI